MKTSSLYMEQMRRRARIHLPPDFARRVVAESKRNLGAAGQFRQLQLIAITAALCVLTVVSSQWLESRYAQEQNLQNWAKTAAQIRVLEESI